MRFCGVVVFFDPDEKVYDNISTYIEFINVLYIIDNSVTNHDNILKEKAYYSKCKYIFLGKNTGLAYALNVGCKMAFKDGYDYCLTMDQDSRYEGRGVQYLIQYAEETKEALICSNARSVYESEKNGMEEIAYTEWDTEENIQVNWTMTSGTLMRLDIFDALGGFDSEMFVGHVDIDYAIRNWKAGKRCIVVGRAIIIQRFGNSKPRKIFWKTVHPSFANPVRSYYIFRNQIYLEKKYGRAVRKFIGVSLWKFLIKMILFEPNKRERLVMMYEGIKDGYQGKMGIYEKKKNIICNRFI